MSDILKDFIEKNKEGFKEKPSQDLWKKIDASLKQENIIYEPKKNYTMLKYGFSASLIIAGTFVVISLQKEKTEHPQTNNAISKDVMMEVPKVSETFTTAVPAAASKKAKTELLTKDSPGSVLKEAVSHGKEENTPVTDNRVLFATHTSAKDSLDLTNWPSAGSDVKKYSVSGDYTSGKTIAVIKSTSQKIDGFITLMQSSIPDKYLGKRIRMTGYLRTVNVQDWAGLWLRIGVKGGDEALAFDNMRYGKKDRSVKGTTERTKYEVVLDVPLNSANIIHGVMLVGTGEIYFDSFILEVVDDSVPTTGGDPDELHLYKTDKTKSYNPRNFWKWYVPGRGFSKDGTSQVNME